MDEKTVSDFKWLLTGGLLMVSGPEILQLGGTVVPVAGLVIFVVGVGLLVGGFFGIRYSYGENQRGQVGNN